MTKVFTSHRNHVIKVSNKGRGHWRPRKVHMADGPPTVVQRGLDARQQIEAVVFKTTVTACGTKVEHILLTQHWACVTCDRCLSKQP